MLLEQIASARHRYACVFSYSARQRGRSSKRTGTRRGRLSNETFCIFRGGHAAATAGIRRLKKPVPSWIDVAPESEFLAETYAARLPQGTRHLLIYGSKKGGPFWLKGENDGVVTVASETEPRIKDGASAVIYLPYGHVEILEQNKTLMETSRFLRSE